MSRNWSSIGPTSAPTGEVRRRSACPLSAAIGRTTWWPPIASGFSWSKSPKTLQLTIGSMQSWNWIIIKINLICGFLPFPWINSNSSPTVSFGSSGMRSLFSPILSWLLLGCSLWGWRICFHGYPPCWCACDPQNRQQRPTPAIGNPWRRVWIWLKGKSTGRSCSGRLLSLKKKRWHPFGIGGSYLWSKNKNHRGGNRIGAVELHRFKRLAGFWHLLVHSGWGSADFADQYQMLWLAPFGKRRKPAFV